jgi:hypothetical protein
VAKQKGLIKIRGTIGDLSFYTTQYGDIVRRKWGPDKDTRKNNPAFDKAEKNSTEFGGCSASGKIFRRAVAEILDGITDSELNIRVNSLMFAVKNLDVKSVHGKRNVGTGLLNPKAIALFKDFNFNKDALLGSILRAPCVIDKDTGRITIKGVSEKGAIKFPKGATHACLRAGWARIDFNEKKSEFKITKVKLLARDSKQKNLVLKPSTVPKIKGRNFFILRISFHQDQYGKQYAIESKKCNAAAVIDAG